MADIIKKATNKFTKGLVMDFSPENTSNELLTHALNATLLTFNGNELSLQNDMGNARVETAFLPEGYIPVGTCEYGGIIYIVSYNPLEDKSQIGCFPSPERNISSDELGRSEVSIQGDEFAVDGTIINNTKYVLLKDDKLNPGDKFIISSNDQIYNQPLQDLLVKDSEGNYNPIENPIIALNVVSIEDSGKIVYLNSDILQYEKTLKGVDYKYHILGADEGKNQVTTKDIDSYRNVVSSGYSVFKSKTSGKLAILAELIMIDSYSVTYSIVQDKDINNDVIPGAFTINIHTEVSPEVSGKNYYQTPKLKYYHLKESQGYLHTELSDVPLFNEDTDGNTTVSINSTFLGSKLSEINSQITSKQTLKNTGSFNFPKVGSYHGTLEPYTDTTSIPTTVYTKFSKNKFHRVHKDQIFTSEADFKAYYINEIQANFYYYSKGGSYQKVTSVDEITQDKMYYVKEPIVTYKNAARDEKYKESTLYTFSSEKTLATDEIIFNKSIEKWYEKQITWKRLATSEELRSGKKELWYESKPGVWENVVGEIPDGVTCYVQESETKLMSIGYIIDRSLYPNEIYYYPNEKFYTPVDKSSAEYINYWDFGAYPKGSEADNYGCPITLYYVDSQVDNYREATELEIYNFETDGVELYYSTEYVYITPDAMKNHDASIQIFISVPFDVYASYDQFVPNTTDNDIIKVNKQEYPKQDPIELYTVADFIPNSSSPEYSDVTLASIKIPTVFSQEKLEFPFKYTYTLVPCMNYGRLEHLKVSNTIDFSKMDDFSASDFNVWKYHIDDNQLRLTFGAEIYDTFEENKVDALILEFYDIWGFAGSLEISGKKAYSGIYTKLLSLNSYGALSKNKISGKAYTNTYKRNINITEDSSGVYKFKDQTVNFEGNDIGWSGLKDEDNDCGVLYSNILYGVKSYLRVSDGTSGYKFIPKSQFFLYTLPIHNSQYYNCDNFNELHYPELDLMLTYKLQDSSSSNVYITENTPDGFSINSHSQVQEYLSGAAKLSNFTTTKYYQYSGDSQLFLEIGLKKEYADFNLNYDTAINKYFSCDVSLMTEDPSKNYIIKSGVEELTTPENILSYESFIQTDVNKLGFGTSYTNKHTINTGNFQNLNFLSNTGITSIPIKYNFVVGYPITISNIRNQEIETSVVCALCHKKDDAYNYEDFGLYMNNDTLRQAQAFWSAGSHKSQGFGLCKQVSPGADNVEEEFTRIVECIRDTSLRTSSAGMYNLDLKECTPQLGKYTFILPHVFGLSGVSSANIYFAPNGLTFVVAPELSTEGVDFTTGGTAVGPSWVGYYSPQAADRTAIWKWPHYATALLTKNTVLYNSEYKITSYVPDEVIAQAYIGIGYDSKSNFRYYHDDDGDDQLRYGKIFAGINTATLRKYSERLITTMKKVYGYNSDYSLQTFKVGDVSTQDNKVSFHSNIISTNASLTFDKKLTFNDFIYFGGACVNKYIKYMQKHAQNAVITYRTDSAENTIVEPQIMFKPNYRFCGTNDQAYLITQLTYNIPKPYDLEQELSFDLRNKTIVRHEDGTQEFINGIPNKRCLYGWDSGSQSLIQLDVSNYSINKADGELTLSVKNKDAVTEYITAFIPEVVDSGYTQTSKVGLDEVEVSANISLNIPNKIVSSWDSVYLLFDRSTLPEKTDFNFSIDVQADLYTKAVYPDLFEVDWEYSRGCAFDEEVNLDTITDVQLEDLLDNNPSHSFTICGTQDDIYTNNNAVNPYIKHGTGNVDKKYVLYCITFSRVDYTLKRKYVNIPVNNIIHVQPTSDYSYYKGKTLNITELNGLNINTTVNEAYRLYDVYQNRALAFTNITLNDLEYDGTVKEHRLFFKNGLSKSSTIPNLRSKIYHRALSHTTAPKDNKKCTINEGWVYHEVSPSYKNYNAVDLSIGPSFDANYG